MDSLAKDTGEMVLSANEVESPINAEPSAPSKNALKKAAKEAEKAKRKAEAAAKRAAEKAQSSEEPPDVSQGKYGNLPFIQSTTRSGRSPEFVSDFKGAKRSRIADINASFDGSEVTLRARVHNLRRQGCLCL